MSKLREKLTYTQIILLSFLLIILVGAVLLCLPISARSGRSTAFFDCLFTSTSATCVTGLVVFDTFTHWSVFGQAVILILIQTGGLGLMTCIAMIALILRKRISLGERRLLMQSAGSMQIGGVVKLIQKIVLCTAVFEGLGAVILSFAFIPDMGFGSGLWTAVFTSVSAFCNAGFDLMGRFGEFSSLAGSLYANDPLVILTLCFLIITGGIGFIVWSDIFRHGVHMREYNLHSKIVLTTSGCLLLLGTVLFFIFEQNSSLSGLSSGQKLMASFFQSVSPRTAGFNSVDLSAMSGSASILMMLLMLVGGSPGSTAGGIKTTTFFVLLLSALTSARRYGSITVFRRKLDERVIVQSSSILTLYAVVTVTAFMIISALEALPFREILFECVSAIGTVGLTMGITPSLCAGSHIVLMILMFAGRVGGLSLMLILSENRRDVPVERPTEKILIG